ncbi:MAG: hypothetical protein ABI425_02430 [Patescibacteria group bacterium]
MNFGMHHIKKKRSVKTFWLKKSVSQAYGYFIYVVAFMAIVVNIPQLITVWVSKDSSGLSVTSWVGFSIISFAWFVYGVLNGEKPIILTNFCLVLVQVLIVLGAVVNRGYFF